MKTLLSISLLVALLWQSLFQSAYIGYWKLNQDKIIKTECINRFKPMMHCNGKCALYRELKKAADEEAENNKLPMTVLKLKPIDTFIEMTTVWQPNSFVAPKTTSIFSNYSNFYTYLNSCSVFHPPTTLV